MRDRVLALLAISVAIACVAAGLLGTIQVKAELSGVTLRAEGGDLFIDAVDGASSGFGQVQQGMRVIAIDGVVVGQLDPDAMADYLAGAFTTLTVQDDKSETPLDIAFPLQQPAPDPIPFLLGIALLIGIAELVRRGLAGDLLRSRALPLAVATAAPILVAPIWTRLSPIGLVAAVVLPSLAALVLASGFFADLRIALARRIAVGFLVLGGIALPALALWLGLSAQTGPVAGQVRPLVTIAVAVAIGTALGGTGALLVSTSKVDRTHASERRADRLPIALAVLTPVVAAMSAAYIPAGYGVTLPLVWLLVAVVALQTNGRVETLRLQRDTIVAATEAERARLAADLHDDALQQMSVLVRRLDQEGLPADAAMARSIADRLRDVCGDLRLPILDELGAGPALEWLVTHVGEASGESVRLERTDTARPPADVELAFFRIAQEALSNAVNHGAPPIIVAYDASALEAALSIIDRGGGISEQAAAAAPRAGHYGLLNMRQRAEQIGARLELAPAPDGGTSVGLRWAAA